MSTSILLAPQPALYFLMHEPKRYPMEWDYEQLKRLFAEATVSYDEVNGSLGLWWTVM